MFHFSISRLGPGPGSKNTGFHRLAGMYGMYGMLFIFIIGMTTTGCAGRRLSSQYPINYISSYEKNIYINSFVNFTDTQLDIPIQKYLIKYFEEPGRIVKSTMRYKDAQLYVIIYMKNYYALAYTEAIHELEEKTAWVLKVDIDIKKAGVAEEFYYAKRRALKIEVGANELDEILPLGFQGSTAEQLELSAEQAFLADRLAKNIEFFLRNGNFLDADLFP